MHKLSKIKKTIILIISVIVSVAIVLLSFLWFSNRINEYVIQNMEEGLKENVNSLALVFESKFTDQQIMLESQARYFSDVDMTRYNEMKETILATKGVGSFKTIGVASPSGSTLNYNCESSGNILLQDYFKEAIDGGYSISETSFKDEDGEDVVAMAVPIVQGDNVIGVIFGTFSENVLGELLDVTSDDEGRVNILLDKTGGILARSSKSALVPETATNFLEEIGYDDFDETIVDNMFDYDNGITKAKVVLTEVGDEGWYFGTVIDENLIGSQSKQIYEHVAIFSICILLGIAILLVTALILLRDNDKANKANERFIAASEQSRDIIFEYIYSTKRLSLDGCVGDIFADGKNEFFGKEISLFLDRCHYDDRESLNSLIETAKGGASKMVGEYRILNKEGRYSWFRMTASMKYNLDDSPYKMVGTLTNADEQHERELLLKEKAELDPLTGIYNKGAFREKVEAILSESNENDTHALYIIDLDYFKNVNDTLGHAMGDQVLMDVAKKLCLVFSERDIVGRIGGDEFAAFLKLESVDKEKAEKIIEGKGKSVCRTIKSAYHLNDKLVKISSSVGIGVYPLAGVGYDALFESADKVLYEVKTGGKNSYKISREQVAHENED